ncbi:MAG: protein kinase [Verrucomicrobiota bacterium]
MDSQDDIFLNAREIAGPAERAAYLAQACVNDPGLRNHVEAMLRDADGAEEFFADDENLPGMVAGPLTEGPGTVIGRYKLLQKIGEGGMGVVYMAEQREPVVRKVALKIIKLGMDTRQVLGRFEAERQALALMDYPNIARILDGGATDTGRPFFVMDLVQGLPITKFCDEAKRSTRERLDLFLEVCSAIQHAHQKGVIHRDIKPANILVTLHGDKPVPKVIDFGIAKATQGRLTDKTLFTQFQHFIGTPAYMSPEQASLSGLDVDTRSDIYGLGVLLYELLTGRTPFDEKELMKAGFDEMRRTIREREPLRPSTRLSSLAGEELTVTARDRRLDASQLISTLRGDVDWIVMKCLEKDRVRRYATAHGLAADLKRYLNNEPVSARPPSTVYRFQKAWRRNRLFFAAASAVALTLMAGLSFSTWSFMREREAHASETAQRRIAVEERRKAQAGESAARHLLYTVSLNLAQQAWEQDNVGRLRQLLEQTRGSADRGFEWFYWQRQIHSDLKTFHSPGSLIFAAFSGDGERIFGGSWEKAKPMAIAWETASGRELFRFRPSGPFNGPVLFTPDGARIAFGSTNGTVSIFDASTHQEKLTLTGHTAGLEWIAFSSNGRWIATASKDQTAIMWDASTGLRVHTLQGHKGWVNTVAFSPDSQRIVTGGTDGLVKVWEVATGLELFPLIGHTDWVNTVAYSPDGERIVTGGRDQKVIVWDVAARRALLNLEHGFTINFAVFSPDSQRVVASSDDQLAKVWDAVSGRARLTLKGHADAVASVAFSPDGGRIVTSSLDGTAKVWDSHRSQEARVLRGHTHEVMAVAVSPDGQRMVTGSRDRTAKVWDIASGRELFALTGHSGDVSSAAFSPDSQWIVTGSGDHTATLWNASNGVARLTFNGHSDWIRSIAFSPDGRRIVTGSYDHTAKVWDVNSGQTLFTLGGHTDAIQSVAFSPDGRHIITGSDDRTTRIWDSTAGLKLSQLQHSNEVSAVAYSPDGQRIATGGSNKRARLWDAASGRLLLELKGHNSVIVAITFSPDGKRLLTGSWDRTAKLWDTRSGQELLTFKGHSGPVWSVALAPDGQSVITGSYDHTACGMDVAGSDSRTGRDVAGRRPGSRQRTETALRLKEQFNRIALRLRRFWAAGNVRLQNSLPESKRFQFRSCGI